MKITINDKTYNVKEAKSEKDKIKGLQGVKELGENEGMLFYFDPPQEAQMWMKDVLIPLDIIFMNDDWEVTKVHRGEPNDETLISQPDTAYVLEVNANSGIKVGDEVEDEYVMKVLDKDGGIQMYLEGGERIISRKETKTLIRKAKKAEEVKDDERRFNSKCKSLGKYIFKVIEGQNTRPPEYVKQ